MNAIDLLEAMLYQNPKLFTIVSTVIKQNHPIASGTEIIIHNLHIPGVM